MLIKSIVFLTLPSPQKKRKKSRAPASKIPRPAGSGTSSATASSAFDLGMFRQKNKRRIWKLQAMEDEYPSEAEFEKSFFCKKCFLLFLQCSRKFNNSPFFLEIFLKFRKKNRIFKNY